MNILGNNALHIPQPQNKERELKRLLDNYRKFVNHDFWLAEIFQKDGIQNSWGAKIGKGKNWMCKIFYSDRLSIKNIKDIVGIVDHGTTGLTGIIPRNKQEAVNALNENNQNRKEERLSAFLSQDWTTKSLEDLGSRGIGKAIFIASSKEKIIYFDSLRSSDNKYIFGVIYLNKISKEIEQEILLEEKAYQEIKTVFENKVKPLKEHGTRIFIINPDDKLSESIINKNIDGYIQSTWWEILEKNKADIRIIEKGKERRIGISVFLPVNKMGVKEIYESPLIELPKYPGLKIKKISLCYLGEKDVPEYYKGIAIQRGGMVIERLPTVELLDEDFSSKIYGTVEMESKLESEMHGLEGPEHYNFSWTSNPARVVLQMIKRELNIFVNKYKLVDQVEGPVNKKQRSMELSAQVKLNDFARKIGLKGLSWNKRKRRKSERDPNKLIRLSFSDFKLPHNIARVDKDDLIEGVYVKPINETNIDLNVLVRIWIFNDIKQLFMEEKSIKLTNKTTDLIGWEQIKINEFFTTGEYVVRSEMRSLEEIQIDKDLSYEKGGKIYTVSRTFWVGMDPKDKGFFNIKAINKQDRKDRFIWTEEAEESTILYYNTAHPIIKKLQGNEQLELLGELLIKEGLLYLFIIRFFEDRQLIEEGKKTVYFSEKDLKESNPRNIINLILENRSIFLWQLGK